jgi:uncharacterized protein YjiS (DUF1127 family)
LELFGGGSQTLRLVRGIVSPRHDGATEQTTKTSPQFDHLERKMNVREFIRRLGDFRQLTRELTSYSDAELADLGIARPDVLRVAMRGAFAKGKLPINSVNPNANSANRAEVSPSDLRYADR